MKLSKFIIYLLILFIFFESFIYAQSTNIAPVLTATGNQIYCPKTSINIVTDMNIVDPDDSSIDAIYIQISSGYNENQDILTLSGSYPNITSTWNANEGKLKLFNPLGLQVTYNDFIIAIKNVLYTNTSNKPTGNRAFSISISQANYLPSNQHYYEYVSALGITWYNAKAAAETRSYYGLKGYLVTILSGEEQQLVGEQALGSGWIGGSDQDREGYWIWMTGPEKDVMFYYNLESTPSPGVYVSNPRSAGYTPNFAFWNRSSAHYYDNIPYFEPNNIETDGIGENFAHITEPGIGIKGSWNDLTYNGATDGPYQPKGYLVEYGGMPDDPIINISTSTSITIPQITNIVEPSRCGTGSVTLEANSNLGTIYWYENIIGGTSIATGTTFSTPSLINSKTFYVETVYSNCSIIPERTPVTATIYNIPIVDTSITNFTKCGPGLITINAVASEGTIYWYTSPTGNSLIGVGNSISRELNTNKTFYVEAVNTTCSNGIRIPIYVTIYELPIVSDEEINICKSTTITIDANVSGMTYLWSTGETSRTISVSNPGIYSVDITTPYPENCTSKRTIIVSQHDNPEIIEPIEINDSIITINLKNPENYFEYSLDGQYFQLSNTFYNVPSGLQTVYVREINSCGDTVVKNFIVVITPKYFTPNNDDINDTWNIKGLENYRKFEITIFDRYGKLITVLNAKNPTWDGTLNGKQLPADDYWFVSKLNDTIPIKKGHFSLKR